MFPTSNPFVSRWLGRLLMVTSLLFLTGACSQEPEYDLVIRGGTLYDGSGSPGVVGDLAISGDVIVGMGDLGGAVGAKEIDATGLATAVGVGPTPMSTNCMPVSSRPAQSASWRRGELSRQSRPTAILLKPRSE